jgi:S1-C subfamily serine protease
MRKLFTSLALLVFVPGLVSVANAETPAKAYLGVAVEPMKDGGAAVRDVTPDSPAAKARLKKGDVILKVDDQEMKGPEALVECVTGHKPGDKLSIHVMREGKEQTLAVTLAERPAESAKSVKPAEKKSEAFLGVWTKPAGENMKGAVVMMVMPDSPAAKAGLMRDDMITALNDQAVTGPEDLRATVQKIGIGKDVTLKVMRAKEAKEMKAHLEASPLGFQRFEMPKHGFDFDMPKGLSPEMEKHFQEMQKRLREFEEKLGESAK